MIKGKIGRKCTAFTLQHLITASHFSAPDWPLNHLKPSSLQHLITVSNFFDPDWPQILESLCVLLTLQHLLCLVHCWLHSLCSFWSSLTTKIWTTPLTPGLIASHYSISFFWTKTSNHPSNSGLWTVSHYNRSFSGPTLSTNPLSLHFTASNLSLTDWLVNHL